MEFWPEIQGQSSLYSKFGTVPGRNCTHNYHDRHQANHYPLYYGEQQDQSRESSYWTVPGSRTGGAPQEYTNWTDQDLTAAASSHFPFILDRHPQQHLDLGEYQSHEARDKEWTAAQRAREYERGFLREGWQRRWEPCNPVRYSREVSTKRSDSSYRELEAWAARYSHSLPRRRRIEAELRGASQGLPESNRAPERDSRSGTDPRVAALQQVLQSASIRESGQWDRGGRQQAASYYTSQTPATDTSHALDMKEKTSYQRRMFSQPPGYIAPPPYNSPRKSSPVLHHSDTSWEQEGKRQSFRSHPTLRKQDVSVNLQDDRKGEKENFTKPDRNQYTFPELEELKHRRRETDVLQASSPVSIQKPHMQCEGMLSLQQPQVLQAVQNRKLSEEPSPKVIEGRKFRLTKKTGGMTIFCLVSRIASTTETPSLSSCTSQTTIQNTKPGGASEGLRDSGDNDQTHKLADEVDFKALTLTGRSEIFDVRDLKSQQKETLTCVESETPDGNLSDKADVPEKANDSDSTFGRQVAQSVQPVSVKYPLWREPSFSSRAETESSSTCLKVNTEERDSDVVQNQEDSAKVHPIDIEVRRLDIKEDTESEDSKGLLVIDTTCVVVKLELIPSPKKEHVHYLDSTPHAEHSALDIPADSPECVQSNTLLNQDVTTDQNTETDPLRLNERSETELDSDLTEKNAAKGDSEISLPFTASSSVPERESLEARAERILGIPLHDCIDDQQPEDTTSLLDSCVEDQKHDPSQAKDDTTDNTTEEEQSQNQSQVGQENDDTKDQVKNEGGEDFARPQEKVSSLSGNDVDSQPRTHSKASPQTEVSEDPPLKCISEEGTEQSQEENQLVENDSSSQHHSQCLSPPSDLSNSFPLSPSVDLEAPNPALSLMPSSSELTSRLSISESNKVECPDPVLIALNTAENLAPHPDTSSLSHILPQQLPFPLPPGSADLSPYSTPHTDHSLSPSPLDQTGDAMSRVEDQDVEDETSQLINNEISEALKDLTKDMTEESQQQFECVKAEDVVCVKESFITEEQLQREVSGDVIDHIMKQTIVISKENATEVNNTEQKLKAHSTEARLLKEVNKDPTSVEQTISQENETGSKTQTEVNILPQQFDNGQEEDASCPKETCMTEEQLQEEADEDPAGLLEQTISKEHATDSQTEIENLQDIEPQTEPSNSSPPAPSESDCEVSQSSLDALSSSELPFPPNVSEKSDIELVSLLKMDSVFSLAADAAVAADIPENVHPPLHLGSCEESLQFSSSSFSDSPLALLPSFSTSLPQEGSVSVSSDVPLKDEPQYPKSLWDAVNRIRKHTAPDSENEEEEVSELWDRESVGEDLGGPYVVADINLEIMVFDEAGQQEVSTEESVKNAEVGRIQQDPRHEEPGGHAEEDTLSCSSASSHGSGDTVIVADEDEAEEMPPDAGTEGTAEHDEERQLAEGERCCCGKVKDETAAREEEEDGHESVTNESSQSEECMIESANITIKAEEMTESEQNEEVVFMPSEVIISDARMIESESVK